MKYRKEMKLAEVLMTNEKSAEVLISFGMHCPGCPSAQTESLEEAALVHGLNINDVLKKLEKDA